MAMLLMKSILIFARMDIECAKPVEKKGVGNMPSKNAKQHRLMEAVAHSPKFAKKVGIPQSVGKEYAAADKGKSFKGKPGGKKK